MYGPLSKKHGLEVIKPEYSLKLKIKRNNWLLADMCSQAANHCAYFEFKNDSCFITSRPDLDAWEHFE